MTVLDSSKPCRTCGVVQPVTEYALQQGGRDGRRATCKSCTRDTIRAIKNRYYSRNKERIKAKQRERYAGYDREKYQRYQAANALKLRARSAVHGAVKRGKLAHPTSLRCLDCDGQARHYDHAHGYDKDEYLNVEPVCTTCHGKRARARGESDWR